MFGAKCFLVLAVLSADLVKSWDIAVSTKDQIQFYTGKTKSSTADVRSRDLTALAYDAVHNMLLFVDRKSDNASILSYHLGTKRLQPLVRKRLYENIQGIAFDPLTKLLFWTDSDEKSIYTISLIKNKKDDFYGKTLFKMENEKPRAIAVDSCRSYIYWTNINNTSPTIERSKFDGSERQVIINKNIYMPVCIDVDQRTKKLFWVDDREGDKYSIESSNLDGSNQTTLFQGSGHKPNALTITKDYIYWVDVNYLAVWRLPKNPSPNDEPEDVVTFNGNMPFGIVSNYDIKDQGEGIPECEPLVELSRNKSADNDLFASPMGGGIYCLNGDKVDGAMTCICKPGFRGKRCEVSVCENYCVHGDCNISAAQPVCSCWKGFSGKRCEVDRCLGYCLNNAACSIDPDHKLICHCPEGFEGERCEITKGENETKVCAPALERSVVHVAEEGLPEGSDQGWDELRDPIIITLTALIVILFVACAFLIRKVVQLQKRPRIKKRIIVNKNVTPLTARPDQCEITIENCCNMNVCETPCFEPRSTIRPTLLDTKPGKEEKRNLIANMEHSDDLF